MVMVPQARAENAMKSHSNPSKIRDIRQGAAAEARGLTDRRCEHAGVIAAEDFGGIVEPEANCQQGIRQLRKLAVAREHRWRGEPEHVAAETHMIDTD